MTPDDVKACIRAMQQTAAISRVYVSQDVVVACWCQFAIEQMANGGRLPKPGEVPIYRGVRVLTRGER